MPVCGKIANPEDMEHIRRSLKQAYENKYQGNIGENIAAQVAGGKLHLIPEFFDPPHHGFDSVYRHPDTKKLIIVESKFTEEKAERALKKTAHGKQGSSEWVEHNAKLMCDPLSSKYSPDNAKIGKEILEQGAENIDVIVIHTDPSTFKSDVTVIDKEEEKEQKKRENQREALAKKQQGDWGECDAANYAVNELGLTAEFYEPKHTGIDSVYRDQDNRLVILESKLAESGSLSSTKFGKQGSITWIEQKAKEMIKSNSEDNRKIGEEILRVGAENVRYLKYKRNPVTLKVTVTWLRENQEGKK